MLPVLPFLIGGALGTVAGCWDAKNLATECIHTWPADAL